MNYNTDTDVNESEFEDIREYQEITNPNTIYELLGDIIILDRYKNNFNYLYDRVVDVAALCWNNRDDNGEVLQHTMIKFKTSVDSVMTYSLFLNRFMISLVFIKPIIQHINSVNINDFILDGYLTKKKRGVIQDKIMKTLVFNGYSIKEIKELIADMALDLKELTLIFAHADMSIYTAENLFLDHYKESEIIRDINNTEYPSGMQTQDIIAENQRLCNILVDEMIQRKNPYFMDNRFASIINSKQIEELYINLSQIVDGEDILPVIMNGNGFKSGYKGIDIMYAGAVVARVPDLLNEEHMGKAGYFGRNLMILTYGTISKTVYDCGSRNPIPITVNDKVLELMRGRYYYSNKKSEVLRVLKETDTHLIGETLYFRSPCTCNLNEDCCHVCYGTTALGVGDLKGGFIYTTELLTSQVSHNILKAKHIIQANAEKINFSEDFENYFTFESSNVIPNDEKKFDIYIDEDYDEKITESLTLYVGKEMKPITISNYAIIDISDEVFDKAKKVVIDDSEYYKISSSIVQKMNVFCTIIPINVMMTQKYMDIMNLFKRNITKFDKVEDVVVELMGLIHKTIPIMSTHGEIIIGKLLRDINNKMRRPNFLIPDVPYRMLPVGEALKNSESATTSISFENTKIHLLSSLFDERNKINRVGPRSFTDYLYDEEVM